MKEARLSFTENTQQFERKSIDVVDPSLLALSLDSLLREAIDEVNLFTLLEPLLF